MQRKSCQCIAMPQIALPPLARALEATSELDTVEARRAVAPTRVEDARMHAVAFIVDDSSRFTWTLREPEGQVLAWGARLRDGLPAVSDDIAKVRLAVSGDDARIAPRRAAGRWWWTVSSKNDQTLAFSDHGFTRVDAAMANAGTILSLLAHALESRSLRVETRKPRLEPFFGALMAPSRFTAPKAAAS